MTAFRTSRQERPTAPKKKRKRSPGPKGRITKRTGDVRSKPEGERSESEKAKPIVQGPLSGAAARHLRGLGHHLEPIIQIGKEGITDGVIAATVEALRVHELVKVKVLSEAPIDRKEAAEELATRTHAALAQVLGRTALLYKRHPHKPKIVLPR